MDAICIFSKQPCRTDNKHNQCKINSVNVNKTSNCCQITQTVPLFCKVQCSIGFRIDIFRNDGKFWMRRNSGLFRPVWGWNQIMSADYWTRKSFRNFSQSETCDSNTRGFPKSFGPILRSRCFLYYLAESRHLLSLVIYKYLTLSFWFQLVCYCKEAILVNMVM